MKHFLLAVVFLLPASALEAAWSVTAREPLTGPPALEFTKLRVESDRQKAELHVVAFSPKKQTIVVLDNADGNATLATAAESRGVLSAVNGGYFHPDRQPLGLVINGGATLHPFERAKLLSGLVVATRDRVSLLRTAEYKPSPAYRAALQAGPFLIDSAKPVVGLNATRAAARTVVFVTDSGRAGMLVCRWVTLAEMAEILAAPGLVAGAKITRALNLDGGSSTGLWVRREGAVPFYQPEGKDVRNYLAIVPR